MSTILNALRRLEEDSSSGETQPTDSLPATDPRATDELRSRILEEEQAAIARAEEHNQSLIAQPLPRFLAIAAVLLGAISLGIFVIGPRLTSSNSPNSLSTKPTALATASPPHQTENFAPLNSPSAANRPPLTDLPVLRPDSSIPGRQPSESRLAAATVTPTQAMREATTGIQADATLTTLTTTTPTDTAPATSIVVASARPARPLSTGNSLVSPPLSDSRRATIEGDSDRPPDPSPSRAPEARPTPNLNLARTASVAAPPIPTRSTGTPIDVFPVADDSTEANFSGRSIRPPTQSPSPSPTKSQAASPLAESPVVRAPEAILDRAAEPAVQQHIASPTPDIAVLQTAWHPTPDHRSAKIRLLASDETLTLREGDAVGPLVVKQITPSAVIFLSGDIELRLRVGQPGSGG